MLNKKKFLAIIPARAESKRLPNKNILELSGKPLIAWSIKASLNSKYIDKTIVSTDSQKIKELSIHFGAEVPFDRPKKIASDFSTKDEVINHAVSYLHNEYGEKYDYVIYLQPTSPLRNATHIDDAIEFLFEKKANSIISVCKVSHPVEWTGFLSENQNMDFFINSLDQITRSQDFQNRFRLNGAIYIYCIKKLIESSPRPITEKVFAFIMEQNVSIDIDTELDFIFAKAILDNKILTTQNL